MAFFSGRISCLRFRLVGRPPQSSGPALLERLENYAIGKQKATTADGIEIGWIAGDHILDTKFDLAKNIVNDTLQFGLRIDQEKIPSDLIRAYTQVELEGLASENPSGRPSARQKKEAKQMALEKLEKEASDGRYLKRKAIPVLWDTISGEILFGTTSVTAIEHFLGLFQQTFEVGFELLGAGRQGFLLAEPHELTRGIDDASPSPFVPGVTPQDLAWSLDETSRDFLGNEFLIWLWFKTETDDETFPLSDKSDVAVMLAQSLVLECPLAQYGKETITSDGPTRLPEARRAIQSGKLPRKVGMILVRHSHQYELVLHAESLAITGARLPAPESDEDRARLEERVDQLRHLLETLDLLYEAFILERARDQWTKELARMQQWLQETDRPRLTATG